MAPGYDSEGDAPHGNPQPNARCPRRHWLDAALAVALIAAAVMVVMTGRASRPATSRADRPSTAAAPALLPSTVRTRIPLPFGQPGDITVLGSTAWISDWSASRIAGVDLAAGRVAKTLQVGGQRDEPVSMTSGAGSLWVLGFAGPLLRIDPASGAITRRFPVRGLGADVAYGDGFIWVITEDPAGGGQEYLYKIDPSRDVIVKAAPIPGAGPACAASPGPRGIWVACAAADRITLISQGSLKPVQSLRVRSGFVPNVLGFGLVLAPYGNGSPSSKFGQMKKSRPGLNKPIAASAHDFWTDSDALPLHHSAAPPLHHSAAPPLRWSSDSASRLSFAGSPTIFYQDARVAEWQTRQT